MKSLNLLIADSAPLYRLGLKLLLDGGQAAISEVDSIQGLRRHLRGVGAPDLIILDSRLCGLNSFAQLSAITARSDTLLMVDTECRLSTAALQSCGVRGVMAKTAAIDELQRMVREITRGSAGLPGEYAPAAAQPPACLAKLTKCEIAIVALVGQGLLNKQIANKLERSESTVKQHISNIYRKTGIQGRTTLALKSALWPDT